MGIRSKKLHEAREKCVIMSSTFILLTKYYWIFHIEEGKVRAYLGGVREEKTQDFGGRPSVNETFQKIE